LRHPAHLAGRPCDKSRRNRTHEAASRQDRGKDRAPPIKQRASGQSHRTDGGGHPNVAFIGEINEFQKADFLGMRRLCCFLSAGRNRLAGHDRSHAVNTVIALAMAPCGVIDHGVSGFVVNSVDEAAAAARSVASWSGRPSAAVRATLQRPSDGDGLSGGLSPATGAPAAPQLNMLGVSRK